MVEWYTKEQIKEAKDNGICYHTLYNRVYTYGWSVEDAIKTKPLSARKRRKSKYYTKEQEEYMKSIGVSTKLFRRRIAVGWSVYDAMHTKNLGIGKKRSCS